MNKWTSTIWKVYEDYFVEEKREYKTIQNHIQKGTISSALNCIQFSVHTHVPSYLKKVYGWNLQETKWMNERMYGSVAESNHKIPYYFIIFTFYTLQYTITCSCVLWGSHIYLLY